MGLLVAVQGCTLQVLTTPPVVPGTAVISPATPPSTTNFAGSKSIYRGTVTAIVTGVTQPGYAQTAPVQGDFIITAVKYKVDGDLALRVTDVTSTITVELQQTSSPFGKITVPVTVLVSDAGQTKALAN